MTSIASKLSSYNIFNYLFPGSILCYILHFFSDEKVSSGNILIDFFVLYFIGLVVSRIGSLVFSKKISKLFKFDHVCYEDFSKACKEDEKIELFSEINNCYRTLTSLFIIVFFGVFFILLFRLAMFFMCPLGQVGFASFLHDNVREVMLLIASFLMSVLFVFSYKKQTRYLVKRVLGVSNCRIIMK